MAANVTTCSMALDASVTVDTRESRANKVVHVYDVMLNVMNKFEMVLNSSLQIETSKVKIITKGRFQSET